VNSPEIALLALGLVLGGALGAAFLVAVRSGPAPRRAVRVTISPNSVGAGRAATLSHVSVARDYSTTMPEAVAAPGAAATAAPMRTRVPVASALVPATVVAVGIAGGNGSTAAAGLPADQFRGPGHAAATASLAGYSVAVAEKPASVAIAEKLTPVPILDVGASVGTSPDRLVRPRLPAEPVRPTLAGAAVGVAVASAGEPEGSEPDATPAAPANGAPLAAAANPSADPCAGPRTVVDDACATAAAKRERSRLAANAARDAQRALDALSEQVDRARELSDPRTIDAAKATMRDQFRKEEAKAGTPDESEAAARRWLHGINQANNDVRSARRLVESGTSEMRERLADVERLARDADAARITAEGAEETCRIARDELARCEEHVAASTPVLVPEDQDPFAGAWPTQQDLTSPGSPQDALADALAGQSAILRVVRGDRVALERVVAAIAGPDPADAATWQIRITALSDAIVARAIEAGYLVLPEDHPFWGLFSDAERREIVEALASLGFRFDGLGGFADGRVPAARDLSLAVGYAGLDRMRIRAWPREGEIAALYSDAEVAADEWLVWVAGDLELGPLTGALGARAAGLGAIWDAWGRVRPALIATD
jgi:hypothetical protein